MRYTKSVGCYSGTLRSKRGRLSVSTHGSVFQLGITRKEILALAAGQVIRKGRITVRRTRYENGPYGFSDAIIIVVWKKIQCNKGIPPEKGEPISTLIFSFDHILQAIKRDQRDMKAVKFEQTMHALAA